MKKLNYLFIIPLITGLFTMVSCQKDFNNNPEDDDHKGPNVLRGDFSCNINGEYFEAEQKWVTVIDTPGHYSVTITGIDYDYTRRADDYRLVSITVNYYEGPKEYPIGFTTSAQYIKSFTNEPIRVYAVQVSDAESLLMLEQDNPNMKGTFNFKVKQSASATEQMHVSDGKFDFPRN